MSDTAIGVVLVAVAVGLPIGLLATVWCSLAGRPPLERTRARWVVYSWGADGLPNYLSGHRFRWSALLNQGARYDVMSRRAFDDHWCISRQSVLAD